MSSKRIPPPEKLKEQRCKLVTSGLRSKSQKGVTGVIRYLPKKDAGMSLYKDHFDSTHFFFDNFRGTIERKTNWKCNSEIKEKCN